MDEVVSRAPIIAAETWPVWLLGAALAVVVVVGRRRGWRLGPVVLATALVVGLAFAWRQRALVDDAYISFRYARSWLEGQGLVFNSGHRVQGYSNPLWTVGLGVLGRITGLDLPLVALIAGPVVYVANVLVVAAVGRSLDARPDPGAGGTPATPTGDYVPLAAALVAVQYTMTAFATSGLEAGLASLCVDLGALALVRGRPGWMGLALIAATLVRMDHALFYAVGAAVVAARWRREPRALAAYALPFVLWLAWAGWAHSFYGSVLPNTFYAKNGDRWYVGQGLAYLASFAIGAHFAFLVPPFVAGLADRGADRAFRVFAGLSVALFAGWVVKIGGDFMYGRFVVSLVPLVLLVAERAVWSSPTGTKLVAAALLGATLRGTGFVPPREMVAWMADENTLYPVVGLAPVVVDHTKQRSGELFSRLADAGVRPVTAAWAIGLWGWHSRLPVLDMAGLTEPSVARQVTEERGRPGHEKRAGSAVLVRRRVRIAQEPPWLLRFERLTRLRIEGSSDRWHIYRYDPALMAEVAARIPEVRFVAFDRWLRGYVQWMDELTDEVVAEDYTFFDHFYFSLGHGAVERAAMDRRLGRRAKDPDRPGDPSP